MDQHNAQLIDAHLLCCLSHFYSPTIGLRYICYTEATLLLAQFIHLIVFEAVAGAQFNVQFCVGLFMVALWAGVIYTTYTVPDNHNHNYLVPHLALSVFTILVIFVAILIYLVMVAAEGQAVAWMIGMEGNENNLDNIRTAVYVIGIIAMVVYSAAGLLEIYFLIVLLKVYTFYKDRSRILMHGNNIVPAKTSLYSAPMMPNQSKQGSMVDLMYRPDLRTEINASLGRSTPRDDYGRVELAARLPTSMNMPEETTQPYMPATLYTPIDPALDRLRAEQLNAQRERSNNIEYGSIFPPNETIASYPRNVQNRRQSIQTTL